MFTRLERALAHLLGWHTGECLRTTDPRRLHLGPLHPECAPPTRETAARIRPLLGWHRYIGGGRRG